VGLRRYVARKTVFALLGLLAVTVLCFVIFQILPLIVSCPGRTQGQCLNALYEPSPPLLGGPSIAAEYQSFQQAWGFFQPIPVRLLLYIRNMFTFNFGYNTGWAYTSQHSWVPVSYTVEHKLPFTLLLLVSATMVAGLAGTGLATIAASRRGRIMEVSMQAVSLLVLSLPVFFLGGLVEMGEALMTPHAIGPSPLACCGANEYVPSFVLDASLLKAFLLPFLTLTLVGVCCVFLIQRQSSVRGPGLEHLLLERAKGVPEREVLLRHAFRERGHPPGRTFAVSLGAIVSAAIVIETVFNWPGLGQAFFMGELSFDLPLMQTIFFILAVGTILAKYFFDVVSGLSDPRTAVG